MSNEGMQGSKHLLRNTLSEEDDDFLYLASPLCEYNLEEIIENKGNPLRPQLTANKRASLTYQLMLGIAELHQLNILHRDLKPSNVLLGKQSQGLFESHFRMLYWVLEISIPWCWSLTCLYQIQHNFCTALQKPTAAEEPCMIVILVTGQWELPSILSMLKLLVPVCLQVITLSIDLYFTVKSFEWCYSFQIFG